MLKRQPVAAGRFYPGNADALSREVRSYIETGEKMQGKAENAPWALMLPHAGYMYCGNVIGQTLAGQKLPSRLIVLCPNHTGYGRMLSVWPEGKWTTPLGDIDVDARLADAILRSGGGYEPDTDAHIGEHSIEVILPFLKEHADNPMIVPVCVGTQNPQVLAKAGRALASVLTMPENVDVGIVISSDMNHYENEKTTLAKDDLALERALAADPDGLLEVVAKNRISMCGAGPLALALYAAKKLGGLEVEVVAHETSGKASGDYNHTVGYAGLRLFLKAG